MALMVDLLSVTDFLISIAVGTYGRESKRQSEIWIPAIFVSLNLPLKNQDAWPALANCC
jgi:hypothetical protein